VDVTWNAPSFRCYGHAGKCGEFAAMTIDLDESERVKIVEMYVKGFSASELSREWIGPSVGWFRGLLRERGVLRSRSEAMQMRWQRIDTERAIMRAWEQDRLQLNCVIALLDDIRIAMRWRSQVATRLPHQNGRHRGHLSHGMLPPRSREVNNGH
jgi:hypothetical protein